MFVFFRQKYHNLISDKKFSEILTGSAWALGARVIATVLGMVTSIIIARCYGAEVLGIVAVLNSFLMLATIFTVLGTNTSILRLIPEHLAKYSPTSAFNVYRKTQYFVAGISIITGAILFFASGFIADTVFSKPHLRFYFALAAGFIIFKSLMQLNTQAVRGLRLIKIFAFMQLLPSLSKLLILVPITIFFFHMDNPIYAMFASITITALAGAIIMDRVFKQKTNPNDAPHPMPIRKIISTSLPMLMTATMTFVIGQTGVIMLGMFRSEAEVGYYAIAVKLATLTAFILYAVNSMAGPKFSELYHSDKIDELFHVARKSAKLIFWTTTPILLCLIVFGKAILHTAFGQEFIIAYPALVLLIMGQFFHSISGATGLFMNMTGNQKRFRDIVFIAALGNVFLNLLLTPRYGLYGAAVAAMVSLITWNSLTLALIKKKFGTTTGYFPTLA
jgi:O-antigen/teichoic acid export membrane protein